jgi:hypothetical protein
MAHRFYAPSLTVPAGTAASSPLVLDVSFAAGVVTAVQIVIPDGHAGFTGLQIAQAHQQVIPIGSGQWIIGNDDKIDWDVDDQLDNGNWQLIGYNTDIFPHTFYVRFLVNEITLPAAQPISGNEAVNVAAQAQLIADQAAVIAASQAVPADEGVV